MSSSQSRRLPGLDAIRAVAILLVMIHHFRRLPWDPAQLQWFGLRSYIGVDLFFVLSGWLIGGQVCRELQSSGRLALGRFLVRRWIRTLPPYLVVVGVLLALGYVPAGSLGELALFLQNYLAPEAWLLSWSLCIEEQFYVALPFALWALRAASQFRPLLFVLVLVALAFSPIARHLAFDGMRVNYWTFLHRYYGLTHLRLDGLVLGVGLAAAQTWRHPLWRWLERRAQPMAALGLLLIIETTWMPYLSGWGYDGTDRMRYFPAVPGFFLVSLGVALLLPAAQQDLTPRWWMRPARWLADHAYALYLTHELAHDAVLRWMPWTWPFPVQIAAAFLGAGLLAVALRQLVEKPALRWRDRVQGRATGQGAAVEGATGQS
jgi:peptidoglycan/LPS O-acetylase OafA/YrhL